jgi:hypothetical protein
MLCKTQLFSFLRDTNVILAYDSVSYSTVYHLPIFP